jgi:hypothetical protein
MPQRNGYKSHRGRSAVARRTEFGGASGTNGIMPAVYVMTTTGERVRTSYFGGPKKGGAAPSATGFMIASGARNTIATRAQRPNFLFKFRQSFSRGYPGAGVGAFGAANPNANDDDALGAADNTDANIINNLINGNDDLGAADNTDNTDNTDAIIDNIIDNIINDDVVVDSCTSNPDSNYCTGGVDGADLGASDNNYITA